VSTITSTAKGLFAKELSVPCHVHRDRQENKKLIALRCVAWVPVPAKGALAAPYSLRGYGTSSRPVQLQYCPPSCHGSGGLVLCGHSGLAPSAVDPQQAAPHRSSPS